MKKISNKPECFSISVKEIAANKFNLSPSYYIEKKKNNKINEWFKGLSLKDKAMLKSYFEFVKKEV